VRQATVTTDYRSILERTLGRLPESTREARETVYLRARVNFVTSLRDAQPPVPEDRIGEEIGRLEDVIRQVEAQFQPTLALKPRGQEQSTQPVVVIGRGLGRVRGIVSRQFELPDPTLPAILEFQRPSTAVVNAPMPRSARGVIWVVTSMVIALIAVCGLFSVDQVVTARGIVVSRSPTILVQPLETAIVRSIDVSEGEQVRAGQILAELDPTFTSADVGTLAAQVSSLNAEVARLQAEADGKPFVYGGDEPDWLLQASIHGHRKAEFELKVENHKHKIEELNSTISKAESDIVGYTKRAEVAQNVEGIRKELEARQLGSRLNTLAAADARVEMQRASEGAEQELQSARRDKEALQAESDSFVQGWSADVSQKLSEATRKLSDATQGLTKAKLRRALVELRADQDGTVQSLAKVSVGSVLQSGQPFITLVPAAAALEVEANVPSSENGFVHVGDPVAIKFDTFPFSQYGMAQGLVRTVSPTSFTAQEEARNPTSLAPVSPTSEPFYRARLSFDRVALHGTPPGFRVTPGMPITADIKVGRRTVLKYFLGRILPVAEEGLREPQN
jgi:hemolysin D